jgi:hypothetical protein
MRTTDLRSVLWSAVWSAHIWLCSAVGPHGPRCFALLCVSGRWSAMITTPITLADDQLEQLADLIAARLAGANDIVAPATDLVTAEQLATQLAVDTKTIYRHAQRLGAIRVGRRLRFDPAKALDAWAPALVAPEHKRPAAARKRSRSATATDLLPVGRRKR